MFTRSHHAPSVSRAARFQGTIVSATVRFSNFGGIPSTTDLDVFKADHPAALAFLETVRATPASQLSVQCIGVGAYRLKNISGTQIYGRYQIDLMIQLPSIAEHGVE